jgi:hypothetical protein
MTPLRISLVIGLSALLLSAGTVVQAGIAPVTSGPVTFVFTATDPDPTGFTGSTITLQQSASTGIDALGGDFLVSWDLHGDTAVGELTPLNSTSLSSISFFNTSTWGGSFTVTSNSNSLAGYTGTGSGDVPNDVGRLDSFSNDPAGVWAPVAAPDSGSTLSLLAAACAGLGACHRWVRRAQTA